MRIEQEKIPSAEEFARREYDDNSHIDEFMERQIDMKHSIWMTETLLKKHLKAIKYEYDQYQFFLDGYRNGSASISEVTEAHDRFLKLLEI